MASEKFRRQLRQEVQLWKAEKLIDDTAYQQISQRYQFEAIETLASNRFVMILIGLGAVLLGLGVITFVAANWQKWPRELKTILLLMLFVGTNTVGFYLWRSDLQAKTLSGSNQRLGEGLLIFGALSLGANLALMSQLFHLDGDLYGLFLIWGLGVLAMAYGLRLTSLGILGILLMGWGYWQGISDIFLPMQNSGLQFLLEHMALIGGILFIPLAYWCQSRIIFILALAVIVSALEVNILKLGDWNLGVWGVISLTLVPGFLWGYDDSLWPRNHSRQFRSTARNLAIWVLSSIFFIYSFRGSWEAWAKLAPDESSTLKLLLLIDVLVFLGLTLWEWFHLAKPSSVHPTRSWGFDQVTTVIAGFLVITAIVSFWHLNLGEISTPATVIFNLQLFLLAAGLIRLGLAQGNRGAFWGGMVLVVLQIVSRTFEYNTELILKALVFTLCGIGVMLAGLWYERHFALEKKKSSIASFTPDQGETEG
ncbi:MAG: DUF2157 domain-containing protein [Microcoleaceae cyanobacterium]